MYEGSLFRYVVRGKLEECTCDWCGGPIRRGDEALDFDGAPYCSTGCAESSLSHNPPALARLMAELQHLEGFVHAR